MNKLAAINSAVEEVNKQAFISAAYKGLSTLSQKAGRSIVNGVSRAKSLIKPVKPPPVASAGGAAASASKPGLMSRVANNPYAIGTTIAAPMVFKPGTPPLPN